ncbi:hypothetical protein Q7L38_15420 [Pseudomonas protegens]|uniref:hypothetical protein n=1 Tax=Pseudomonas protegens TaxID=380021 RepID=UPI00277B285F|nr:hypothetical protein [Pseudomonas protegens]MDP9533964.1 hypothetical protein [Pseudomonas protegens]
MSKIVVAVNVMIENKEQISSVQRGRGAIEGELFFLYEHKHKWSIFKVPEIEDEYILCYYPGDGSLRAYAQMGEDTDWDEIDIVFYRTKDIGTKEARQSFAELYSTVKELNFGMDAILDAIISSRSN